MNKRIKQLAEQAEILITEVGAFHNTPRGAYQLKEQHMKKFAELIVKECMYIARHVGNSSEPDDFALDRCYEIEQRIQDRFGVEE
jgi:hypothetical protein